MKTSLRWSLPLLALLAPLGCAPQGGTQGGKPSASPTGVAMADSSAKPGAVASSPAAPRDASKAATGDPTQESRKARFDHIANDLSEPDAEFFSDNIVSNETSYLQVADSLPKLSQPGGVYLGVGPEQNFTYIAMSKPSFAVIVDIRRQNLLLHLLYKAAFEEAKSRAGFLALMLGRDHDAAHDEKATDGVAEVLDDVRKDASSKETFARAHALLMKRVATYGVKLSKDDEKHMEAAHQTLFDGQLGTEFSLKENNGRSYPTLEELVTAKAPDGTQEGFLASDAAFRFVQTMENEHRVAFMVGDFAGDKAMPGLAALLHEEKLAVSAFYVSNVEQYLLEPKVWSAWLRNVEALPKNDASLFVRCYLDQGKKHPLEMKGHRTATVLQKIADFEDQLGKTKTATFWDISTAKLASGTH